MAIVQGYSPIGMLSAIAMASAQDAESEIMSSIHRSTLRKSSSEEVKAKLEPMKFVLEAADSIPEPGRYIIKLEPRRSGMRHVSNFRRCGKSLMVTERFIRPRLQRNLLPSPQANVVAEPKR